MLAEIASQLADLRGHLTELYTPSALSQLGYRSTVRLIDVGRDLHGGADEIHTNTIIFTERNEAQCCHSLVYSASTGLICGKLTLKLDMNSLGP